MTKKTTGTYVAFDPLTMAIMAAKRRSALKARRRTPWAICESCQQSCTGMYGGKPACTRCTGGKKGW